MIYVFRLCQLHPSISYTSFLPQLPPGGLCGEPPSNTKSCAFNFQLPPGGLCGEPPSNTKSRAFNSNLHLYGFLRWAIENHQLSAFEGHFDTSFVRLSLHLNNLRFSIMPMASIKFIHIILILTFISLLLNFHLHSRFSSLLLTVATLVHYNVYNGHAI